jgi:predicted neutral ceramidase superfamily lipid hydrolase
MKDSLPNNKVVGVIGVIFGSIGIASLFIGDINDLVIPLSDIFFVKYAVIIGILNCSSYFIVIGILIFIGKLIPYYKGVSRYEKARSHLFTIIFLIPFVISLVSTIIVIKKGVFWSLLGLSIIVYYCWSIYANLRLLKDREF